MRTVPSACATRIVASQKRPPHSTNVVREGAARAGDGSAKANAKPMAVTHEARNVMTDLRPRRQTHSGPRVRDRSRRMGVDGAGAFARCGADVTGVSRRP